MPEDGSELEARVAALERALTDGREGNVGDIPEGAAVEQRLDGIERRLADLEERLDELDAGLQAVQGYIGEVEHVNREVERQAEAALAAVERLEDDHGGGQSPPVRSEPTTEPEPRGEPTAERRPVVQPEWGPDQGPHGGRNGAGGGTDEADSIGAWPPAEDDRDDRGDENRDGRGSDQEEVDPGDVLSRVRDAL